MPDELIVALTAFISVATTALGAWARTAFMEKRREERVEGNLEDKIRAAEAKGRKDGRKEVLVEEIHENTERALKAQEVAAEAQKDTAKAMQRISEVFVLVKEHMDSDHIHQTKTLQVLEEILKRGVGVRQK